MKKLRWEKNTDRINVLNNLISLTESILENAQYIIPAIQRGSEDMEMPVTLILAFLDRVTNINMHEDTRENYQKGCCQNVNAVFINSG